MLVLLRAGRWPIVVLAGVAVLHWAVRSAGRLGAAHPARAAPLADAGPPLQWCHLCGVAAWTVLPILIPFLWSKLSTPIFQLKYAIVAQAPALILFAVLLFARLAWGYRGRRAAYLTIAGFALGLMTVLGIAR